jgi:ABC-2 type transport system ATP-binding protein
MPHVATTVTGALSSGQLTRLHLCKAFINDPAILFLDEPTASLDADIAVKVRATLRYMQRQHGVTIIYTSHNMHEIEHMCDEVLFLTRGQAVMQGAPQDVIARTRTASLEEVFITIARDGRVQDIAEARESH